MKRLPAILAIGFILITFFRVAQFLQYGMKLGWLGVSFAFALTMGVYTSAYLTQFKETRKAAIFALIPLAIADLWFNNIEMVRSLASVTLINADANFLGLDAKQITTILHASAIVYGCAPTIFAALLGWLQADTEKVASLNKRGLISQILWASKATFTRGLRAQLEDWFGTSFVAQLPSGNSGKALLDAQSEIVDAPKVRWEDLLAQDKDAIAQMTVRQLMAKYPAISRRTANNWKSWVASGKQ